MRANTFMQANEYERIAFLVEQDLREQFESLFDKSDHEFLENILHLDDDEKYAEYIGVVFHLVSTFLNCGVYIVNDEKIPDDWLDVIGINSGATKQLIQARASSLIAILFYAQTQRRLKEGRLRDGLQSYWLCAFSQGWAQGHNIQYSTEMARSGALARLANDPKQIAKSSVRDCWELWQRKPNRYKGPTAFARDMREKFENLDSEEVIRRWCREWKVTTQQA